MYRGQLVDPVIVVLATTREGSDSHRVACAEHPHANQAWSAPSERRCLKPSPGEYSPQEDTAQENLHGLSVLLLRRSPASGRPRNVLPRQAHYESLDWLRLPCHSV